MGGIGDINRTAKSEEDVVEVKMRNYVPRGGGGFGGGKGGTHDDVVAGLSSPLGSMTTRILPNAKAPHLSTTTLFLSSEKRGGKDDDVNDVNDDDDDDGGKGEAKKRNWDLKRDVARRMEKLDRETKRAVAELARDEEQQQQQQQQQQHE